MTRQGLLLILLLAAVIAAILAPLIANDRPWIVYFAPVDYYASQYEEFQAVWVTEALEALGGTQQPTNQEKGRESPPSTAPMTSDPRIENLWNKAESMAALVEKSTAQRIRQMAALARSVLAGTQSPTGPRHLDWNSAIPELSELLRPKPGLVPRQAFFPAFQSLQWSDVLLLALLLAAAAGFHWRQELASAAARRIRRICSYAGAAMLLLILGMTLCKLQAGPAGLDYAALRQAPDTASALWPPIGYLPQSIDLNSKYAPPGRRHWLGTDSLGRDLLSRLLWGARVSLSIGFLALATQLGLGVLLGGLAGMPLRWTSPLFSRVIEGIVSIPAMLLALTALALIGPSYGTLILTVALAGCAPVAQMFRSEMLRLRNADFIRVAWNLGLSRRRIFFVHLLPNALTPLIGHLGYGLAAAILMESSLSFLGLGVQIPTASWGGILSEARGQIQMWWLAFFPGLCILAAVLSAQSFADKTQQALSIRPRQV